MYSLLQGWQRARVGDFRFRYGHLIANAIHRLLQQHGEGTRQQSLAQHASTSRNRFFSIFGSVSVSWVKAYARTTLSRAWASNRVQNGSK